MALRHHPDKALPSCRYSLSLGPQGAVLGCSSSIEARLKAQATTLFAFISAAHEELTDAVKRRKVDQLLEAEDLEASGGGRGPSFADIFGGYGSSSSDYSNMFGGSRGGYGGHQGRSYQYQSADDRGQYQGWQKASNYNGYNYRPAGSSGGGTNAGGSQKPARGNSSSSHAGGAGGSSSSQGWGQRGGGNAGRYTSASQSSRPWWGDTAGQDSDGWETDSEEEGYTYSDRYRSHL
jgi:curved DNA-binding protein CbpA